MCLCTIYERAGICQSGVHATSIHRTQRSSNHRGTNCIALHPGQNFWLEGEHIDEKNFFGCMHGPGKAITKQDQLTCFLSRTMHILCRAYLRSDVSESDRHRGFLLYFGAIWGSGVESFAKPLFVRIKSPEATVGFPPCTDLTFRLSNV